MGFFGSIGNAITGAVSGATKAVTKAVSSVTKTASHVASNASKNVSSVIRSASSSAGKAVSSASSYVGKTYSNTYKTATGAIDYSVKELTHIATPAITYRPNVSGILKSATQAATYATRTATGATHAAASYVARPTLATASNIANTAKSITSTPIIGQAAKYASLASVPVFGGAAAALTTLQNSPVKLPTLATVTQAPGSVIKSAMQTATQAPGTAAKNTLTAIQTATQAPRNLALSTLANVTQSPGTVINSALSGLASISPPAVIFNALNTSPATSGIVSPAVTSLSALPAKGSKLIDSVISARDKNYEESAQQIANGDTVPGGIKMGATVATDVLLPLDLANVGNLYLSGRGDEVTQDDLLWAAVDAIGLIPTPLTILGARAAKAAKVAKGAEAVKTAGALSAAGAAVKTLTGGKKTMSISTAGKALTGAFSALKPGAKTFSSFSESVSTLGKTGSNLKIPSSGWYKPSFTAAESGFKTFNTAEPIFSTAKTSSTFSTSAKSGDSLADLVKRVTQMEEAAKTTAGLKTADAYTGIAKTPSTLTSRLSSITGKVPMLAGVAGLGYLASTMMGGSAIIPGSDADATNTNANPYKNPTGGMSPDDAAAINAYLEDLQAQYEAGMMSYEQYISALEAEMADLQQRLENGELTQAEYEKLLAALYDQIYAETGQTFDPALGEWSRPIEAPAQEISRWFDDIPIVGDVMAAARQAGLAAPALAGLALVTVGGSVYVLKKTKSGKVLIKKVKQVF